MPDLDLVTRNGRQRVFSLLHSARPLLLDLGTPRGLTADGWAGRVQVVGATYDGRWELPVIGEVTAPTGVLVRPDGHVAWVGAGGADGLEDALASWFGPPAAA
jgi:3-(3-hydroxy-phenyl)propionate hydroxylase